MIGVCDIIYQNNIDKRMKNIKNVKSFDVIFVAVWYIDTKM